MRRIGGTEAGEHLEEEAKKVDVGDYIELRHDRTVYSIDDVYDLPEPDIHWEPVEVIKILPSAPAGNRMVLIRHADGHTRILPLIYPLWRPRAQ